MFCHSAKKMESEMNVFNIFQYCTTYLVVVQEKTRARIIRPMEQSCEDREQKDFLR